MMRPVVVKRLCTAGLAVQIMQNRGGLEELCYKGGLLSTAWGYFLTSD